MTQGPVVEKDEIKSLLAMVGEPVTLQTDITELQENQLIRWKFADSRIHNHAEFTVIAKWDKTHAEEYLYNEERFKERLKLDHKTGSLTITNITPKLCGHYKLHITTEGKKISVTFNVVAHLQTRRRQTCPL